MLVKRIPWKVAQELVHAKLNPLNVGAGGRRHALWSRAEHWKTGDGHLQLGLSKAAKGVTVHSWPSYSLLGCTSGHLPALHSLEFAVTPSIPTFSLPKTMYVCPSPFVYTSLLQELSHHITIGPPCHHVFHSIHHMEPDWNNWCPSFEEPKSQTVVHKEARRIQKIKRKKMKRHLLKKFRKRMFFTLKKQRLAREKKKMAAFQARLDQIKLWGESFSAEAFVQEELEKARRGGFYINIMNQK